MSYSFSACGATKAEVMAMVVAELDKVVESQPIHAADRKQAQVAAEAIVGTLADPSEKQEVLVTVSGYLTWASGNAISTANVNVTASLKEKAA